MTDIEGTQLEVGDRVICCLNSRPRRLTITQIREPVIIETYQGEKWVRENRAWQMVEKKRRIYGHHVIKIGHVVLPDPTQPAAPAIPAIPQ